jgi:hypothetical protein
MPLSKSLKNTYLRISANNIIGRLRSTVGFSGSSSGDTDPGTNAGDMRFSRCGREEKPFVRCDWPTSGIPIPWFPSKLDLSPAERLVEVLLLGIRWFSIH